MTDVFQIEIFIALLLSSGAFALALAHFYRTRPFLYVELSWDVLNLEKNTLEGVVTVTNIGIHPMFVRHVALEMPTGSENRRLILNQPISGQRLDVGDGPEYFFFSYSNIVTSPAAWQRIRAYVEDGRGRKFYASKPPESAKRPSWTNDT